MKAMATCRALALALIATGVSGCVGFIEPDYLLPAKRVAKVREVADLYGQYVRFGRIPEAATFVRREDRKAFLETFMRLDGKLEFTSAEIVTVETASALTVEVWATYELFALPSVEIRKVSERQLWHFDPMRRRWMVQPDLAVFPGSGIAPSPDAVPAS